MHIAHKTAYALLACSLAGLYWLTLPRQTIEFDSNCAITDGPAKISALLHPRAFWQTQIAAAQSAEQWEERLPAATAHDEELAQQNATSVEARLDRLSTPAKPADPAARQQEQIDAQNQRMDQIAWLGKCADAFKQRMGN